MFAFTSDHQSLQPIHPLSIANSNPRPFGSESSAFTTRQVRYHNLFLTNKLGYSFALHTKQRCSDPFSSDDPILFKAFQHNLRSTFVWLSPYKIMRHLSKFGEICVKIIFIIFGSTLRCLCYLLLQRENSTYHLFNFVKTSLLLKKEKNNHINQ